uniref:UDP-2-acetamido-2-deoxy-ribo-hexuluronate aminotransferase n=1 Tax=Candidatus Kentrum sp. SD TaxID=2126332 RepID=A0A450YUC1_9GAMM|nr:MAG: UDP-2-acetamido-2-deoxy-ribo-hexuluronate aminotransferase [Candidatus Kentron sp. SD]VFK49711.1 MAG: UDP-2-acetamido-2-deoxy-ribo-hexuluronate aminotransferase [Candidatus Kentron sp. SD]
MDLLLDVNVAVDICAKRRPFFKDADLAVAKCLLESGRVWLYAGGVQTLEYVIRKELGRNRKDGPSPLSIKQLAKQTRNVLKAFSSDKHWLAALASEGPVFDSLDPEDEQLLRALDRFPSGSIKLLTRDQNLLDAYPEKTITPKQYCQLPLENGRCDFVDLKTQQDNIRPQLERNIHEVLHHGQYILGPEVRELEQKLAAYTESRHCVTVASGTEALLISLMALGIRSGDEVITTPFTFVATAEVIALLGAIPVFVDIQPDTCNIDPASIAAAITPKTKAIMPVSLYGQPADMDEINAIAARHGNIPVIEDAAQSFGASYKGKKSCNLSTLGCASFFPSKPLGCYGDGGAIFTNDDALAKACREIRVHGQERRYHHTRIGVGGRMDTLQCAVVLAKLEKFDEEIEQRIRAGKRYLDLLNDTPGVRQLAIRPDRTCVWGQFTILVENREQVSERLRAMGIPTAVHYPMPLHRQPAYQELCRLPGRLDHAERVAKEVLSLPMHPYIGSGTQEDIVMAVAKAVE